LNYEDGGSDPSSLIDEENLIFHDGDEELWDDNVDYEEI
jgi:hypothetical protein